MIGNLVILFHFFNFTLGLVALIILSRRVSLVSPDIQKAFILQALFYNISIIFTAVIDFQDYFFWNIVRDNITALSFVYLITIVNTATYILWTFFYIQMVYKFLNISADLTSKPWFKKVAAGIGLYLVLLLFVRIFKLYPPLYFLTSMVISYSAPGIALGYSIFLNRRANFSENVEHKRALKIFSILFIIYSSINLIVFLDVYPFHILPPLILRITMHSVDLLYNVIIIFWGFKFLNSLNTKEEPIPIKNASIDLLTSKYQISKRELEVINLICEGKTNQEIADTLFISLGTVKNHLYNIYSKIGIKNRTQLAKIF